MVPILVILRDGSAIATRRGGASAYAIDTWLAAQAGLAPTRLADDGSPTSRMSWPGWPPGARSMPRSPGVVRPTERSAQPRVRSRPALARTGAQSL